MGLERWQWPDRIDLAGENSSIIALMSSYARKPLFVAACLAVIGLLLGGLRSPAVAAPLLQLTAFPTPTPGPDGRIIYIVQPGDTLWRVSAITGVSLDELRTLNNLGADEVIVTGQKLLLGLGGPAEQPTSTPGPSPTPAPQTPTATAQPGSGTLCVLVFEDQNGDSLRQEEEPSIPGGAINVSDRGGNIAKTETTETGMEPICFSELPEGDYNITVAIPEGFNPTTVVNYALRVEAGSETYLDFGAQPNAEQLVEAPPPTGSGPTPAWGLLGGALIAAGIALGVVAGLLARSQRPRPED
jgi:hypothetical protein